MVQSLRRAESASTLPEIVSSGPCQILTTLRPGEHDSPLYLFPGAGGDSRELSPLARQLGGRNPIVGVELAKCAAGLSEPLTVKSVAHRSALAIRAAQPSGPYFLAGYSFGGLVAVEVAQLLREADQQIGCLVLIDAFYDQRFWPMTLFLKSQSRRMFWHLKELVSEPLGPALAKIGIRTRNLLRRVRERFSQSASRNVPGSISASIQEQCIAAIATYRPFHYPGQIIVIRAEADDDFACNPVALWRTYSDFVRGITIPGSHLGTVRDPESISQLAAAIDGCLSKPSLPTGQPTRPHVLVMTAFRWPLAGQLARTFHDAGAKVDVLCPKDRGLARAPFVDAAYWYSIFSSVASLRAAITAAQPDLLIPCDDPITSQLHQLYESTDSDSALRALLARSLGSPEKFETFYSRVDIARKARELDVPCPKTALVTNLEELRDKLAEFGLPAVLKLDETWGGMGVAIVRTAAEAECAFARLRRWPSIPRAFKRLVMRRDAALLRRVLDGRKNVVSLQEYVDGRPANAAVACWKGKVLASVLVEVLESDGPTGPATVVRVIDHPGMSAAVERMVERLKLSGLCGFDFILRTDDASAQLIELNPRATPACRLLTAEGATLSAVLCDQLRALADRPSPLATDV